MIISNFAVHRSTTVFVLLLLVFVVGIYCYFQVPREAMPEVEVPIITVTTTYAGVSPGDMETLITIPIERQLSGIAGVEEITSTSVEGVSAITVEFEADVIIESALQKVRDKVNLAESDLPEEADDSMVQEVNMSERPIMLVSLTGNIGIPALSEVAEDIEDKIEGVPGVLEVDIIGDMEREIQIVADPGRIAQYGITLSDLVNLLRLENVNTPGGAMDIGEAKYLMRVPGEFASPEELQGLVVKRGESGVVYLRDIAEIRDDFKQVSSVSRVDGMPAVTLSIKKRSGDNIIQVTRNVNALLEAASPNLPSGVAYVVTEDQSVEIRERVEELEYNIFSGLVLVLIIVLLFMGFSNAVFVALSIPVSFLITFAAFILFDISLNMIVLFSLTLSLGMLVDNGIVVIENIFRHAQAGLSRFEAAKKGASEVALPVIASTMTTIAAFSPLFFWPTMMGEMMRFLPQTLTIILSASLFVGLIVSPALASVFMQLPNGNSTKKRSLVSRLIAQLRRPGTYLGELVLKSYKAVLQLALRWRLATITAAVMSLFVIFAIWAADFQVIFMPESEPFSADITVTAAQGTDLETTDSIVRRIEKALEPQREHVKFVVANSGVGGGGSGNNPMSGGGSPAGSSHKGSVTIHFPPFGQFDKPPTEVLDAIRPELEEIPGAEIRIEKQMHSPPTGAAVNLELTGDDFGVLETAAVDIRRAIRDVPGLVDLRDDYDRGKPEVRVTVDRGKAWLMGLNTQVVGMTVRAAVDGAKAGEYREGDEEHDVMVRFPEPFREDLSNIASMSVMNTQGDAVPFSSVAKMEHGAGLGTIKHIDRKRTLTISGGADGRPGPQVLADVTTLLGDVQLPAGVTVNRTGEFEDMGNTQNFLGIAFIVGLFLMAIILITQFNSIIQPLIILSSVILSLAGVFLGLLIFDMPFGAFMTGLGCISLAGIVVNNAIVLIDFINQERGRGTPATQAIVMAGMIRFRPVTLTAVTTILGLIPMAVGISFNFRKFEWMMGGPSSQYWGSMAIAICFGLAFATLLTLLVVPVLYSLSVSLSPVERRREAALRVNG